MSYSPWAAIRSTKLISPLATTKSAGCRNKRRGMEKRIPVSAYFLATKEGRFLYYSSSHDSPLPILFQDTSCTHRRIRVMPGRANNEPILSVPLANSSITRHPRRKFIDGIPQGDPQAVRQFTGNSSKIEEFARIHCLVH